MATAGPDGLPAPAAGGRRNAARTTGEGDARLQSDRWAKRVIGAVALVTGCVLVVYYTQPEMFQIPDSLRNLYAADESGEGDPIVKASLVDVAADEVLKSPNKLALEHNVSVEHVKVAVIAPGEKVRTKLVASDVAPPEPVTGVKVPTGIETKGDVAAEVVDKAPKAKPGVVPTVDRDYKFEEMFIDHPDLFTIKNKVKELTIQERVKSVYVTHSIPNKEMKKAPPVLLLHGAKFSSSTWEKTGTIKMLVDSGLHAYTVDLPGYGRSEGTVDATLRDVFLEGLITKLKLKKPFIVSPSMSGSFSVPFLRKNFGEVSGFIPVAATGMQQVPVAEWKRIADETHVMYVYGDKDDVIGVATAKYLEDVDDIQFFKVKDGTHPCYIDKPRQFNKKLRSFILRKLSKGLGKKFFLQHRNDGGFDHSHDIKQHPNSGASASASDKAKAGKGANRRAADKNKRRR